MVDDRPQLDIDFFNGHGISLKLAWDESAEEKLSQ